MADFCTPLIGDIADALIHAAGNRDLLEETAPKCREFAEQYDADRVFADHWVPTLAALEGTLPTTDPIRL